MSGTNVKSLHYMKGDVGIHIAKIVGTKVTIAR